MKILPILQILVLVGFSASAWSQSSDKVLLQELCTEEIGTQVPNVGTYVAATPSRNFQIRPMQCMITPDRTHMVGFDSQGYLVTHPINADQTLGSATFRSGRGAKGSTVLVDGLGGVFGLPPGGVVEGPNGPTQERTARRMWQIGRFTHPATNTFFAVLNDGNIVVGLGLGLNQPHTIAWDYRTHVSPKDYCAVLFNNVGRTVGKAKFRATTPEDAETKKGEILAKHNRTALAAFLATGVRVQLGGC